MDDLRSDDTKAVDAAIAKAVLAEREACAKIADEFGVGKARHSYGGSDIAAVIRARV